MTRPHEARLHIDGGPGKRVPVRCEGYVENGEFHVEAVWLAVAGENWDAPAYTEFDIIENLKPSVVEALEQEATDALQWEGM